MTGPVAAAVAIPIVAMVVLAFWLALVFYADSHPYWKGRQPPAQQALGLDIPQARTEPQVPSARAAPAVPGQRLPLTDERRRAATAAGSASSATEPPQGNRPRRLLLGENRLQFGERVADGGPGRLDHGPAYSSGKRKRCAVPGAYGRPPLVAAGQSGTDAVER
jgi:hypothetical protein